MFNNTGNKCKTVAKLLCWIGIVSSIIVGLIYIFANNIGFGIGYMVGGSFISWIGSLGLYGIGEAVENSAIAANLAVKADMEREQERKNQ